MSQDGKPQETERETILIVDDNREIVSVLTDVLESRGYTTLAAYDGLQGLQLALRERPNLIMLDWNLPQMAGIQVLQALRQKGNQAPVVLMTIYGSESVAVQAFRLGVRDYIRKPLRIPETLATIERALGEDRLRREKERIAQQLEVANKQLEQQLLELTTLQAIGQSVTSVLDLDEVLNRVLQAAAYFTDAREGTVFLLDEEKDELALHAYYGLERGRPTDLRLRYSTNPLRRAIETRSPLFLNSKATGYSIKLQTDFLVQSLLYVPLYVQDKPLGVLGVTDKLGAQQFTPDDVRLLTSLATYAAIAIENARLYQSEKELARVETVKQMIVTLSHYIMNPLTAISLGAYELSTRADGAEDNAEANTLQRNLQLIDMNIKEIVAVISILQELVSPKSTTYVGDIEMIDIEDEVKRRVEKIRAGYRDLEDLLGQEQQEDA